MSDYDLGRRADPYNQADVGMILLMTHEALRLLRESETIELDDRIKDLAADIYMALTGERPPEEPKWHHEEPDVGLSLGKIYQVVEHNPHHPNRFGRFQFMGGPNHDVAVLSDERDYTQLFAVGPYDLRDPEQFEIPF